MNIIFMGTPDFAVQSLKALIDSDNVVQAVFTQPDKPKGRGNKLTPPPVKVIAEENGIPVYQPISLKKGEDAEKSLSIIKELAPDLIIVVAYGKLLPKEVLEAPKKYCINVHGSLLPKYRGAGPIQWSVLNGEKETGVTTMLMGEGLDTGDMLLKSATPIGENETASELYDRLSVIGAELLIKTIGAVKSDTLTPVKQNDSESSYSPMLTKELCPIDFTKPAVKIHNQICGLSDWPCATAELDGKRIKIYKSEVVTGVSGKAGEITDAKKFIVACGDGNGIKFNEIQTDGGKRMSVQAWLCGNKIEKGTLLK